MKGKVALSINNKFINLGDSTDVENRLTEDQGKLGIKVFGNI